jgi:hypothetical protein
VLKPDKCKVLHISKSKNPIINSYSVNNHNLKAVDHHKHLGIWLQKSLSWDCHVNAICAKANRILGLIRRSFGNKNPTAVKTAFLALVRPILEYASPIWSHCSQSNLKKLEKVQANASKIILGATNSTNNETICKEAKLSPLTKRFNFALSRLLNKAKCSNNNHITKIVLEQYQHKTRLKRSSPLQLYKELEEIKTLECFSFLKEPKMKSIIPQKSFKPI